jgi:hypothetical protein
MDLTLKRIARRETYTIGHLYIDGKYFCDTIEDTDRGLKQSLPQSVNIAKKRKGVTAIPEGRYLVVMNVKSPKFSTRKQYDWCGGYLPRLVNVPAFDGVLIHIGNTAKDSAGCILVGKNTQVGKVLDSTATFKELYQRLKAAKDRIYITIK